MKIQAAQIQIRDRIDGKPVSKLWQTTAFGIVLQWWILDDDVVGNAETTDVVDVTR